jgi:hypothetical protein
VAVIIKLLAADRAQIWMIRASLPVTDCEKVTCRAGLRSRCAGIGCWSFANSLCSPALSVLLGPGQDDAKCLGQGFRASGAP